MAFPTRAGRRLSLRAGRRYHARRVEPGHDIDAAPAEQRPRWTWLGALVVVLIALPTLILRAHAAREWADEGYFANGALRMLAGQVPYRDFQHNYPPGRAGLIALLISIFGHDLSVVRALWIACHAAAAALAVVLARRAVSLPFAMLTGLAVVLNVVFLNKSVELFLAAGILLVLVRVAERRTSDLVCGLALGAGAYLRHDAAVFASLVFPVALLLATRAEVGEVGPVELLRAWLARLRRAWPFLVGMLLALAPVLIWLGVNGALLAALRDLTLSGYIANDTLSKPFPLFVPTSWRDLVSEDALYPAPLFLYALALAWGVHASFVRPRREGALLVVTACFGALLFSQVLVRTDIGHLEKAYLPAHVAGIALIGLSFAAALRAARSGLRARAAGFAALALLLVVPAATRVWYFGIQSNRCAVYLKRNEDLFATVEMPHGSLWVKRRKVDRIRWLLSYMERYADRPGEQLVVFPAGALFNFLYGLENPLRYDILRPGELAGDGFRGLEPNRPDVLDGIEAQLEANPPRFLLFSGEDTNEELEARMRALAERLGYYEIQGAYLRLFIRQ